MNIVNMLKDNFYNFLKRVYNILVYPNNSFFNQNNNSKPFMLLNSFTETIKITFLSTIISFSLGFFLSVILYLAKIERYKSINKFIIFIMNSLIFIINTLVNFLLSIPFVILVFLIIDYFLGDNFGIYHGFKAGLICLVSVLTAHSTRNIEQVFLQINPEIYKTAYTLGASKIQFIRYFLLKESISYLVLKFSSIYISSMAYSSVLAIIGVRGIAYIAYQYGFLATHDFTNFTNSDLIFVCSFIIFLWIQIIYFLNIFIFNKLNKNKH
ncbi:ABC transporter permease subunit [Candidatus Phytoplasma sacchari]